MSYLVAFMLMAMTAGIILSVFFGIKAYFRFKDLLDGDKDELWNFLALCLGGVGLLLIVISSIPIFTGETPSWLAYYTFIIPFSMTLMLVAIASGTLYMFLKWWRGRK